MKRAFLVPTLFLLVLPNIARAQHANAEKEVRDVLKQMIQADLTGDAATLDRIFSDDFTITRDNGVVRSRAETLQGVKEGATKFEKFDTSDVRVRVYGNTAVVTFHESIRGKRSGQDMAGEFQEVRVFVKRGGNWQAVLAQRTKIEH